MTMNGFVPIPSYPTPTIVAWSSNEARTYLQYLEKLRTSLNDLYDAVEMLSEPYTNLVNDVNVSIASALQTLNAMGNAYDTKLVDMQNLLDEQLATVNLTVGDMTAAINTANSAVDAAETATNLTIAAKNDFETAKNQYLSDYNAAIAAMNTQRTNDINEWTASYNSFVNDTNNALALKGGSNDIFVNVKALGAKGDNVTDDTAILQSIVTNAGRGATVFFPKGVYLVSSTIIIPAGQRWLGTQMDMDAETAVCGIRSVASGVPTVRAVNATIEHMRFDGPGWGYVGTCAIYSESSSFTLNNVSIRGFEKGIYLYHTWYTSISRCFIYRCNYSIDVRECFNVKCVHVRLNCDRGDKVGAYGIRTTGSCDIGFSGGSIESYQRGIDVSAGTHLSIDSTYFEVPLSNGEGSAPMSSTAQGIYIQPGGANSVNSSGNYVYLAHHDAWIRAGGDGTQPGPEICSTGNRFKKGDTTYDDSTAAAYKWYSNYLTLHCVLMGDKWGEMGSGGVSPSYQTGAVYNNSIVQVPNGALTTDTMSDGNTLRVGNLVATGNYVVKTGSGTSDPPMTGNRANWKGALFYNETSGTLKFWTGTAWKTVTAV